MAGLKPRVPREITLIAWGQGCFQKNNFVGARQAPEDHSITLKATLFLITCKTEIRSQISKNCPPRNNGALLNQKV